MSETRGAAAIVLLGIGNAMRGDDGIGIAVARELRPSVPRTVRVHEAGGDPADLLDIWQDAQATIVIDAVSSGSTPGTIHRFDASAAPLPERVLRCSTHTYGASEAIELARVLDQLPPRVIVYGIEGESFEPGAVFSAGVEAARAQLVERVREEITTIEETLSDA